jgi:predicted transcriptional regulator
MEAKLMNRSMTQQEKQTAYDAWFVAEVDKGIADCDAGNVLSEEEAEQDMVEFMSNLHKKHARTAA